MKKIAWTGLIIILSLAAARGQEDIPDPQKDNLIEQKIETIAETDGNYDYTSMLDKLEYYRKHPINLNHTNREELGELNLLNDILIFNLLKHIEKNGSLVTIYELQTVEGFEPDVIARILPYVVVSDRFEAPHLSVSEMLKNSKQQFLFRYQQTIEEEKGYSPISDSALAASPNSRYLGNKMRLYARYRFTYSNHISAGITAQKDEGEEFFKGTQKQGFDFYSAHVYLHNFGKLKSLAVGDYQAQFGQGLTLWSGLGFGKSSDATGIKRNERGIAPYTSVDENLFLRGAAATIAIKKLELTGFASRKKMDANVSLLDSVTNVVEEISSLQTTGYHNTVSTVADRDAITETLAGGNVAYRGKNLKIGASIVGSEYNAPLKRNLTFYNQFEFASDHNMNAGLDYSYLYRNLNLFGEVSRSLNGGMASLNGAIVSLDPRLTISILQRYFERDFQPIYNHPISQSGKSANEKGLLLGISAKPIPFITLSGYYDRYTFGWLRYQVNAPSQGSDYIAQVNYTPSKKLDAYFRIRHKNKEENSSLNLQRLDYLVEEKQTNYRFNISYTVNPALYLRNRVELIDYRKEESAPQKGYFIYQDIIYKPIQKPISITFRYALFDTDGYESRIYGYENDVLYSYSIPSLYDRGSRTYVIFNYQVNRSTELWVRYAQTFYNNRQVISEGSLNEIQGSTKSDIKVQVRFTF